MCVFSLVGLIPIELPAARVQPVVPQPSVCVCVGVQIVCVGFCVGIVFGYYVSTVYGHCVGIVCADCVGGYTWIFCSGVVCFRTTSLRRKYHGAYSKVRTSLYRKLKLSFHYKFRFSVSMRFSTSGPAVHHTSSSIRAMAAVKHAEHLHCERHLHVYMNT